MTDSVMSTEQPGLQVREGDVDHRQVCIGSLRVAIEHHGLVRVPQARQLIVAAPAIGAHHSALGHILLHEPRERLGGAVWHETQSQSSCVDGSFGLFAIGAGRPRADFDGPSDRGFMVDAVAFALGTPTDKCLIHLNRMLGSDSVALRPYHPGAELVENVERCLVAPQPKLSLKLHRGLPWRLCRHKVSSPEPCRQRRVTVLHDGARHERDVGLARAAPQYDRPSLGETVGLTDISALHACKPVRPSQVLKVPCAGRVIGEYPLKFWECRREAARVHGGI